MFIWNGIVTWPCGVITQDRQQGAVAKVHGGRLSYGCIYMVFFMILSCTNCPSTPQQRVAVQTHEKSQGRGDFVKSALCGLYMGILRLHYIAVLYNADSILKRSPCDSQMFFPVECVKMSADDRILHNSSCENCTPWGGVNESLDIQCLRNRGSCVIKRWLSNFCLQNKTAAACGKRGNDG